MDRLFVYGSLQPGGPNEHVLEEIGGEWEPAAVRGRLVADGWGAKLGYPGLVLDDSGDKVQGHVFSSTRLDTHWSHLDAFEGAEYQRVVASVALDNNRQVCAHIYVLRWTNVTAL